MLGWLLLAAGLLNLVYQVKGNYCVSVNVNVSDTANITDTATIRQHFGPQISTYPFPAH